MRNQPDPAPCLGFFGYVDESTIFGRLDLFGIGANTPQSSSPLFTLRSSLKFLKLVKSAAGGIDEKLEPQSKGVDPVFDAQAFEFEDGIHRHEDVVALGSQSLPT